MNLVPGAVRRAHPAAPLKDFQEIMIRMMGLACVWGNRSPLQAAGGAGFRVFIYGSGFSLALLAADGQHRDVYHDHAAAVGPELKEAIP